MDAAAAGPRSPGLSTPLENRGTSCPSDFTHTFQIQKTLMNTILAKDAKPISFHRSSRAAPRAPSRNHVHKR